MGVYIAPIQQSFLCVFDAMVEARTWDDILELKTMTAHDTEGNRNANEKRGMQKTNGQSFSSDKKT